MALEPGAEVVGLHGTYRVEARHAEGSFGVTYRASEVPGGSALILKELRLEKLDDWKALELFEREGRVLAGLSHPSIPAFKDFFAHGGPTPLPVGAMSSYQGPEHLSLVLVQELIPGVTLQQRVDEGQRLAPHAAEDILRSLLHALDYLHERTPPLIHRDIKPGNVIMTPEGHPYLVDFGAIQDHLRATGSVGSTIVGTLGFMPLEQTRGRAIPSSDLYALGVTMVVALSGRPVEELRVDESTGQIAVRLAVPRETPKRVVEALDGMVRLLASHRAQSAADVLKALDKPEAKALPAPSPRRAKTASRPEGELPLVRINPGIAALVGTLALLAVVGGMVSYRTLRARAAGARFASAPVAPSATYSPSLPPAPPAPLVLAPDCKTGTTTGCASLGQRSTGSSPPDYDRAVDAYQLGCDGGDGRACNNLAVLYDNGTGVPLNVTRAYRLFDQACTKGNARGCYNLGRDLVSGRGALKDPSHAVVVYQMACDKGDGMGCNALGWRFLFGQGTDKAPSTGLAALKRSCDLGDRSGCDSYAFVLLNGLGGPKDEPHAKSIFEKACADSEGASCMFIGFMNHFGRATTKNEGVAKDFFMRGCVEAGPDAATKRCDNADDEPEECGIAGLELALGTCGPVDKAHSATLLAKACRDGWTWVCDRMK